MSVLERNFKINFIQVIIRHSMRCIFKPINQIDRVVQTAKLNNIKILTFQFRIIITLQKIYHLIEYIKCDQQQSNFFYRNGRCDLFTHDSARLGLRFDAVLQKSKPNTNLWKVKVASMQTIDHQKTKTTECSKRS